MPATHLDHWTFTHRLNWDGSFDSICPVCLEMISHQENEDDLVRTERAHECDPTVLGKLSYFWNAAQD
jgi:hypothetical protein